MDANESTFAKDVLETKGEVLVDFWAPWCGPCRAVSPVLEEIEKERADFRVVKVNIDENPRLAAAYGVQSIPNMVFFKDGKAKGRIIGAQPKSGIERSLEQIRTS